MTAPTCPTCDGSGEVPVNPEAAWSGHVQALTFRPCADCAEPRVRIGDPIPCCIQVGHNYGAHEATAACLLVDDEGRGYSPLDGAA